VIPRSPAANAGLQPRDIIVSLDGFEIESAQSFLDSIGQKAPSAEVRLSIRRDGREKRLTVKLSAPPAPANAGSSTPQLMLDTGGHMALIRSLAFTPDGRQLVSASDDKTIRVWDLKTGRTLRTIRGEVAPGDAGKNYAMALSPDGKWLAAGGWFTGAPTSRDSVRLYDFASGNLVALMPGHTDVILGLAFSPDGKRLISGSADHSAIIWDVERGVMQHHLRGHKGHIFAVGFTPDNARAVTGSYDKELRMWRVSDGKQIASMPGHGDRVRSLAMTPDGTIYSGDSSGEIRVWNGETGAAIKLLIKNKRTVSAMSITPDGKYLLTGEGEGTGTRFCHVYDLDTGQEVVQYKDHDNIVLGSAISPDGKWAATGGGSFKEIHIWDVATGKRRAVGGEQPLTLGGLGRSIWAVGWSPDGRRIGWGYTDGGLNSGPLQYAMTLPGDDNTLPSPEPLDEATAATFRRAQVTHEDRMIRHAKGGSYNDDAVLEFLKEGRVVGTVVRGQSSGYDHRSYTFSNDGMTVLSGGSNGVLASYDRDGGDLKEYVGHEGDVWAVVPSPDDRFVLSGSADQTVRLWNMKTHELLFTLFHSRDGEWVMWTPQGYYVGSPRGAELVGWQINKGIDKVADYVTAAQLRKALRRSDIVHQSIRLASAQDAVATSPGTDRSLEQLLARRLPKLELVAPQPGVTVRGGSARITVALAPSDDPVKLIRVSVNGTQLKDILPGEGGGFRPGRVDVNAPLANGENLVTLVAVNTENYESEPLRLRLAHEGEGWLDKRGTLYLVSIGVDAYPSIPGNFCLDINGKPKGTCNLDFAGKDATAFHDAMKAGFGPLHEHIEERLLVNAPGKTAPTADAIRDVLGLLRKSKPNDTVVVFLSGHGYNEGRDYLLLPTDAEWSNELRSFRRSKALLWTEIQTAIQNAQGRRLLFMDTCHAGNSHAGGLDEAAYYANIIAYYSARWDQLAVEAGKYGHGAFTKALIEGVNGSANGNGDQQITTEELRQYLDRRVPQLAAEYGREQNPQFFQARDAQIYAVARVR
jgi:WD40 repeat protein